MSQIARKFIADQAIDNSKVSNTAGIVYSKLDLSNSILNGDINSAAAIAYSKLALTNSIVNADIASAAAIVYSKLDLSASVQASDMNSGAASSGDVLTADGAGGASYLPAASSGANTALSNLTTTSINQDLLPSADLARSIGSSTLRWLNLFVENINSGSVALNAQSGNVTTGSASGDLNLSSGNYGGGSGNSGAVTLSSGGVSGTGTSGDVTVKSGASGAGASGSVFIQTSSSVGGTSSGNISLTTATSATSSSGAISLSSGAQTTAGSSGAVVIKSGNSVSGTATSGDVTLESGTSVNARGNVILSGDTINLNADTAISANSKQIHNVQDPTSAQDAATKNYVDTAVSGSSITPAKETIVLSGTDITNQYIDLAAVAKTDSILFMVQGSGNLLEGASYDYSVSYTGGAGGNTRITFLNDLATAGVAALVAADVVQVNYLS